MAKPTKPWHSYLQDFLFLNKSTFNNNSYRGGGCFTHCMPSGNNLWLMGFNPVLDQLFTRAVSSFLTCNLPPVKRQREIAGSGTLTCNIKSYSILEDKSKNIFIKIRVTNENSFQVTNTWSKTWQNNFCTKTVTIVWFKRGFTWLEV